jgi:hypothetical protein
MARAVAASQFRIWAEQGRTYLSQGGVTISKNQWIITIVSILFDFLVVCCYFMLIFANWYQYSAFHLITLSLSAAGSIAAARIFANKELLKK